MSAKELHEYAFDCRLWATVRVQAATEAAAREAMVKVIDSMCPTPDFLDGFNQASLPLPLRITEVSLDSDGAVELFEIDGVEPLLRRETWLMRHNRGDEQ